MEHDKRDNENNTCLRSSVQLTVRTSWQTNRFSGAKICWFPYATSND